MGEDRFKSMIRWRKTPTSVGANVGVKVERRRRRRRRKASKRERRGINRVATEERRQSKDNRAQLAHEI